MTFANSSVGHLFHHVLNGNKHKQDKINIQKTHHCTELKPGLTLSKMGTGYALLVIVC